MMAVKQIRGTVQAMHLEEGAVVCEHEVELGWW